MPAWIRAFLWRLVHHKSDGSLDQELEFHLDMEIAENLRQGMSPEEARRRALIALGGIEQTREAYRETGAIRWLDECRQDLRYAVRMLARSPAFSLVAASVLALGIGASTAVVSIIDSVVFRPWPVWQPDRLVGITMSYPDFLDLRSQQQSFSGVAAFGLPLELENDQHPGRKGFSGRPVTADFFQVLGLRMARGRGFLPEEDTSPGTHPVAVISYRMWQRDFDADPAIVGKTLKANGETLTIIGVAPKGFRDFGYYVGAYRDVWIPMSMFLKVQHLEKAPVFREVMALRDIRWLTVVGRLKPGISLQPAQAHVRVISERLKAAYPKTNGKWDAVLSSINNPRFADKEIQFTFGLLLAAAICIFLLTSTNVGSLLLGRASARQREIATRVAVGASRSRVVRQLLTEGLALSALSFPASLAVWILTLRMPYVEGVFPGQSGGDYPRDLDLTMDYRILAITLCITCLTILIFALAPALTASRPQITSALKNQDFLFTGRAGSGWRRVLVVVQIAVSVILLAGAGLFIRTISRFHSVDPGFDQNVLILDISQPFRDYDIAKSINFFRESLERIRAVPGVLSASYALDIPPERGVLGGMIRLAQTTVRDDQWHWFDLNLVTPGYFKNLRMSMLQGRDFTDRDDEMAPGVAVVNEMLARRYWPGASPLEKRFEMKGRHGGERDKSYEIIGVVEDAQYSKAWDGAKPYLYFPVFQAFGFDPDPGLHVRVSGNPSSVIGPIRKALEDFGPDVRVSNARLMSEEMNSMLSREHSTASVLGIIGSIALILAAVGLYGVVSYYVIQHTHEFGIRMALGAQPAGIIRQIIREGMTLVFMGLAVGLPCSMALSRFVASRLHGVSTADPPTYVAISSLCVAAIFLAVLLAARRATKNPIEALRFE